MLLCSLQVPGAEVVILRGLTKEEIRSYYERAKLNIDTYVTGRERALFEGSLFNVVPVVKFHAPVTDPRVCASCSLSALRIMRWCSS